MSNESLRKRRGSKEEKSYGSVNKTTKIEYKSYQSTDITLQKNEEKIKEKIDQQERIGTLKNNYYSQIKQEQQNQGSWFYEVIQDMISYIYQIVQFTPINNQEDFPEIEIGIDDIYLEKLEEFKEYSNVKYDKDNELHEKMVLKLWKLSCPNIELQNRISEQWKDIGFQGKDPSTDFRGVGLFGLWNLIFFATSYPKKYSKYLEKTKKVNQSYPFAIAGFNVTMMLFDILGFGMKKSKNTESKKKFIELILKTKGKLNHQIWFQENEEEIKEEILLDFGDEKKPVKKKKKKGNLLFEQVYVASFKILHEEWYLLNANYFSFPKVLENTRKRVEDYLENQWNSIEDIIQFNKKL